MIVQHASLIQEEKSSWSKIDTLKLYLSLELTMYTKKEKQKELSCFTTKTRGMFGQVKVRDTT